MNSIAQLEQTLYQYTTKPPREELRIAGWRFAINQQEAAKVGIRDNKLGEVYAAPSVNQGCSGDLLIIWPGDLCSHATVNSAVIADIKNKLPIWQRGAFHDPEGAVLLKSDPFPLVALEDDKVRKIVQEDQEPLFQLLAQYMKELPNWNITSVQAGASAGWGIRHIRTSQGLSVSYAQTSFSTYVAADGLFSKSFAKRRLPKPEEITELLSALGSTVEYLKQEASAISGKIPVIFAPGLVQEFSAKYLLPNLSGNSVVNSQGAFSLADFQQHRKVFDPRINIIINPLRALELSSYLCTREGLPAEKCKLVEQGNLLTPFLTVKDSVKAGLKPTSLPQGAGIFLEVSQAKNYQDLIRSMESGILVHNVMGLHTQDSTSGNYSLSAPHCLKVENGKIIGRVKAVLSGNFLHHLADPTTQFGTQPSENFPAMQFLTNVVAG
jgi:PmbA protein